MTSWKFWKNEDSALVQFKHEYYNSSLKEKFKSLFSANANCSYPVDLLDGEKCESIKRANLELMTNTITVLFLLIAVIFFVLALSSRRIRKDVATMWVNSVILIIHYLKAYKRSSVDTNECLEL